MYILHVHVWSHMHWEQYNISWTQQITPFLITQKVHVNIDQNILPSYCTFACMYVIFCCSQQMANAGYNLPAQGHGYVMPPFVPPPYWMQQMFAQQVAAGRIPQPNMYMPPN